MNTKLLLLAVVMACLLLAALQPKKEKYTNNLLKNTVEFKNKLRAAIAGHYNINEARIRNIVIEPTTQRVTFTISNTNTDGSGNFTSVHELERLMNGSIQDGTMAINVDGTVIPLSSLDGRAQVVSAQPTTNSNETFTDKYIDDYDPTYDNIDIVKTAHHVMDKYNYAPLDGELTDFIKLEYDKNMKLKAVKDINACF